MMITLVLSSNMKKMLKDNVLVRKLDGIETSGSLNILFTDKTGTITKGQLEVTNIITGDNKNYHNIKDLKNKKLASLLNISIIFNNSASLSNGNIIGGNTTDRALLSIVDNNNYKINKTEIIPFDSINKFSSVKISGDENLTLIKGSFEKILPHCNKYYNENKEEKTLVNKINLNNTIMMLSKDAIRIIVIATSKKTINNDQDIKDLTLVSIIGIKDEVRKEAKESIKQVKNAGIQVIMITGDSKDTAYAIAREIDLLDTFNDNAILTSDDLNLLSDDEIKTKLSSIRVISRALPQDKSRLVRIAQELNLVVGMTGDGVNDAPALKKADVGFGMGNGTEVAKEASDIVILDNNFLSIAKAILYGRTIFKSIRKFIIFQLTVNICAVGLSIIGPFIGINTPVTVIQMLWINMVMDTFAALAFAREAPIKDYMKEPPKKRDEKVINKYMFNEIFITGIYSLFLCILFLKLPIFKEIFRTDINKIYFMTAFFALFIFIGIFNAFNARTHRLNLFAHILKNKTFIFIMAFISIVQIILIYHGGSMFRTSGLTLGEFELVILVALSVIPFDWIRKCYLRIIKKEVGGV